MLMCFLRVCPFIKPVGKNCVVEKREDQCCPSISCPPVPVELWTSTELPPALPSAQSTDIGGGLTLADLDPSGLSTIDSSILADLPMSTNPRRM